MYAVVQDLDSARTSHTSKSYDYRTSVLRLSPPSKPYRSSTQLLHIGMTSKVRVLNGTTETRALIPPELVPQPSAINAKVMDI